MAKAKQYIGESYTDSAGQQWRWDAGKKTYVRNYGTSPMASIKRSWNQKIVPAGTTLKNAIQNRNPEGVTAAQSRGIVKEETTNINEYFNSILQERWDNATTEEEKASVKDLMASFNVGLQKDIITEETGAGTTSVIPESFSEYRGRTAGQIVDDEITKPPSEKEVNKVESGVLKKGEPEEVKEPPFMSIADLEKWELDTRDTTPAGRAFGESGAQQRMNIRKNYLKSRGTLFDDNVRD